MFHQFCGTSKLVKTIKRQPHCFLNNYYKTQIQSLEMKQKSVPSSPLRQDSSAAHPWSSNPLQDETFLQCFKPSSKLLSMSRSSSSKEDSILRILAVTEWCLVNMSHVFLKGAALSSSASTAPQYRSMSSMSDGSSDNCSNCTSNSSKNVIPTTHHHHRRSKTMKCTSSYGKWKHRKDCYTGSESVSSFVHEHSVMTKDQEDVNLGLMARKSFGDVPSSSSLLIAVAKQRAVSSRTTTSILTRTTTSLWKNEKYRMSFSSMTECVSLVMDGDASNPNSSSVLSESSQHVLRFESLDESYMIKLPSLSYNSGRSALACLFASQSVRKRRLSLSKCRACISGTLEVTCVSSGYTSIVHFRGKANEFQGTITNQTSKDCLAQIEGSLLDQLIVNPLSNLIPFDRYQVDVARDYEEYYSAKLFPTKQIINTC